MKIDMKTPLLKRRRTKIIATIGPASADPATIDRLVAAGVNVFRLNMSHGDQEGHRALNDRIRAAAARAYEPVAILADLGGPKIRCGRFRGGSIELEDGSLVVVTTRKVLGEPGLIPSQYAALADDVRPGDRILLDDGNLELRVEASEPPDIRCRVIVGGQLRDRKGMNLPEVAISAPSLTDKDRSDAVFAMRMGVEYLALSFVRRAADVLELRDLTEKHKQRLRIIVKVEKPQALEEIEDILDAADGIMVARGDLGVEMPPEVVPVAQDKLVELARATGKPVIIATQMMDSMIRNPRPTRAEVSDVAQAVKSGADAVMLSGETAAGAYPVRAVQMMDRVIRHTEAHLFQDSAFSVLGDGGGKEIQRPLSVSKAIGNTMSQLSRDLEIRGILVATRGGASAMVLSAARPAAPMIAITADALTCRQVNLLWGVVPIKVEAREMSDPVNMGRRLTKQLGLASPGQYILVVRGFHPDPERNLPSITVVRI